MPSSNFKLFDENKQNILTSEEYNGSTARLNGVQSGIASSKLHNKSMYQQSLMAYALAQIMVENGIDASDEDAVVTFIAKLRNSIGLTALDKCFSKLQSLSSATAALIDSVDPPSTPDEAFDKMAPVVSKAKEISTVDISVFNEDMDVLNMEPMIVWGNGTREPYLLRYFHRFKDGNDEYAIVYFRNIQGQSDSYYAWQLLKWDGEKYVFEKLLTTPTTSVQILFDDLSIPNFVFDKGEGFPSNVEPFCMKRSNGQSDSYYYDKISKSFYVSDESRSIEYYYLNGFLFRLWESGIGNIFAMVYNSVGTAVYSNNITSAYMPGDSSDSFKVCGIKDGKIYVFRSRYSSSNKWIKIDAITLNSSGTPSITNVYSSSYVNTGTASSSTVGTFYVDFLGMVDNKLYLQGYTNSGSAYSYKSFCVDLQNPSTIYSECSAAVAVVAQNFYGIVGEDSTYYYSVTDNNSIRKIKKTDADNVAKWAVVNMDYFMSIRNNGAKAQFFECNRQAKYGLCDMNHVYTGKGIIVDMVQKKCYLPMFISQFLPNYANSGDEVNFASVISWDGTIETAHGACLAPLNGGMSSVADFPVQFKFMNVQEVAV